MYGAFNEYVRSCPRCQTRKQPTTKPPGNLHSVSPPEHTFQKIEIDFLGPFPVSANNNGLVIVAMDYMTRYVETKFVPDATEREFAESFLSSIPLRHGAAQSI